MASRVTTYDTDPPMTPEGVAAYLASPLVQSMDTNAFRREMTRLKQIAEDDADTVIALIETGKPRWTRIQRIRGVR